MKAFKKIIIAVVALVLAAAIALGIGYTVLSKRVPALEPDVKALSDFDSGSTYAVVKSPYIESGVFETRVGIESFWAQNRTAYGVEFVLQCTADGELVVLNGELPETSNAEAVLGSDTSISGNTLEKLQKVNLLYGYTDADGKTPYKSIDKSELGRVSLLTLDDVLYEFGSPAHYTSMLYFRFLDESAVRDMTAALEEISRLFAFHGCAQSAVLCVQSDDTARRMDKDFPALLRTATDSEMRGLYGKCIWNRTLKEIPYVAVLADKDSRYASEKFIHYVRNLGLAIAIDGVSEDEILTYRSRGASALFTADVPAFNQIIKDAKKADQKERLEAKQSAAQ